VSENMLTRASAMTKDGAITYTQADMEQLTLPPGSFDLVYSSLAFHYIADLKRLLGEVYRSLRPGGRLVFSVEHPIYTAPGKPAWCDVPDGGKTWPVDSYLLEGPRSTDWLAKGVIKQHRTLATYINLLLRLGFVLSHVEEWGPTEAQIAARPALADERHRPPFLLLSARKQVAPGL
jgi:SAM-dependent methyltransferase